MGVVNSNRAFVENKSFDRIMVYFVYGYLSGTLERIR